MSAKRKPPVNDGPRLKCFLCGHINWAEQSIHSHYTGNHYCADFGACDKRRAVAA